MIIGRYANQNYNVTPFIGDIPYEADTLILFQNNKYSSSFWGEGKYRISYSINGTNIDLSGDNKSGEGGFNTSIKRMGFGVPKIILVQDLNQYYEKID